MACGFDGNSDVFGIGIRIGFYTQILAVWFSNFFVLQEAKVLRSVNNILLSALVVAGFVYAFDARKTSAVEAFLLLEIGLGLAFVSVLEVTRYNSRYTRPPLGRLLYTTLIVNAGHAFNVLFWWIGLDVMLPTPCEGHDTKFDRSHTLAFYFVTVNLYGWMRTVMKVLSILGLLAQFIQMTQHDIVMVRQKIQMRKARAAFAQAVVHSTGTERKLARQDCPHQGQDPASSDLAVEKNSGSKDCIPVTPILSPPSIQSPEEGLVKPMTPCTIDCEVVTVSLNEPHNVGPDEEHNAGPDEEHNVGPDEEHNVGSDEEHVREASEIHPHLNHTKQHSESAKSHCAPQNPSASSSHPPLDGLSGNDSIFKKVLQAETYIETVLAVCSETPVVFEKKYLMYLFGGRVRIYVLIPRRRATCSSSSFRRCVKLWLRAECINKPDKNLRMNLSIHMVALRQQHHWQWPRVIDRMLTVEQPLSPSDWEWLVIASDVQLSQMPLHSSPWYWTYLAFESFLVVCAVILQVEFTLAKNNVRGLGRLTTLGQLIPFLVGLGGLFKVLWAKWELLNRGIDERAEARKHAYVTDYERALEQYIQWKALQPIRLQDAPTKKQPEVLRETA